MGETFTVTENDGRQVWRWSPKRRGWIRWLRVELARCIMPADYRSAVEYYEQGAGEIIISRFTLSSAKEINTESVKG